MIRTGGMRGAVGRIGVGNPRCTVQGDQAGSESPATDALSGVARQEFWKTTALNRGAAGGPAYPSRMPNARTSAPPVAIRLISPSDSLRALTDMLHRAYKRHKTIGLEPVAANQPEEVTRRRIAAGECYVAELAGTETPGHGEHHNGSPARVSRAAGVVGTILFRAPTAAAPTAAAATGPAWLARTEVAHFAQFAVDPAWQGRGIGRLLMETAERRAVEIGAAEIALSTPEPAAWLVAMYERHGYRIVERWHWAETNYMSVIMSKRL